MLAHVHVRSLRRGSRDEAVLRFKNEVIKAKQSYEHWVSSVRVILVIDAFIIGVPYKAQVHSIALKYNSTIRHCILCSWWKMYMSSVGNAVS